MDPVIVMLADQPFITVQMLEEMIACTKNNPTCRFVATTYEQTIMPPVLFSSSMYTELLELRADKGAKAIYKAIFFKWESCYPALIRG